LVLNENGKLALEYSNKIFALGNEMTRRIISGAKEGLGTISIGIEPSLSRTYTYRLLIPVLEAKDVQIKVDEADLKYLYLALESGDLDFVLTDNYDPSKGYAAVSLGISKYFAVGGKKYAKAVQGFPQSLNSIPFFNFTKDTRIRHEIEHYFLANELYPVMIGEADNLDFLRTLTQKNQCFTILPENFVREPIREKKLFVIGEISELKTNVKAIYNPNTTNRAVQSVIQYLKERKLKRT
jgi:LysR family transcriptional regulator, transcriptional activator of nhaA